MAVFTSLGHVRCFLGNGDFEQMLIAIKMELKKDNSISENPTKIKVSFDFHRVSDSPNWENRVRLCTYVSEKN